jgi:antitoxin HicB
LTPDPDGGFTITFRNVPEAITEGDTREEALLRALESALAMYIGAKEPLPTSFEPKADEGKVPLSALGMAKAALYDTVREQGVGRAELARRQRWHLPQVSSLLDLRHASRMEHVEADGTRGSGTRSAGFAADYQCGASGLTSIRRKGGANSTTHAKIDGLCPNAARADCRTETVLRCRPSRVTGVPGAGHVPFRVGRRREPEFFVQPMGITRLQQP